MILDVARRRADLSPGAPAVRSEGEWLTYAELNERAERLASLLRARGVGVGERVSIVAHNHLAHLDLILATAKHGFVYSPLNTRLAEPEQAAIGAYLRPSLILHDGPHLAQGRAAAGGAGAELLSLEEYEAELARAAPEPERAPRLGPEDVQMILLTGGTTGRPKGAMLPYRQGFYNAVNTVMSWGLTPDDCAIQATPAFHAAVNALTVPLLHLGARVVLQPSFDAGDYLHLVEEHGVSLLFLVPTMFHMLTEHEAWEGADLSSVRWAISGGAACPEPVRAAFMRRGVRFKQGYGLSEAGVNCFSITLDQAEERPASVGKPVLHAEAAIRDEYGEVCAPGEVGELTLRGPHVFSGYFEREEETAQVLKDGWLHTGDLAVMDEEGFYTIVGRRKEMFVSGGENVYPSEVEAALYDHPAVAECAVLAAPDPRWGEVGVAAVTLHAGQAASPEELQAFLKGRLAGYKVPKRIRILPELPKSGAGKILKTELASELAGEEA